LFRDAWTKVRSNDEHHDLFESVEQERDWGLDGLKLLNNYMQIEDPTIFEPLERERWVRGSIEDLNLRGILDRMDRNSKGELVIVDYKSGKAPMAKYKEPRFFALKLYALLIKEELNEIPAELKLIYLKNSTIHTLKISDEDLVKAKSEIMDIWKAIKKAFEENDFPATKNNLCDWCYYKPICPVFNKSAPDTDGLKKINEEIKELNENLEALNMFDNPTNLPKDSPLSSLNKEKIQENLELLKNKRNDIEDELQELLRK
jgi:putative RecB family exonuclease